MSVGFQKSVSAFVDNGYPGDISSAQTAVNLYAKGGFAKGTLVVGNACFLVLAGGQGNQFSAVRADAGATAPIAGFVSRNQALAPWSWANTAQGYSMNIEDGRQVMPITGGQNILAVIAGIDEDGLADHVPLIGEQLYVKEIDGSLACAPVSVTAATGYVKATGWTVSKTGLLTSATVGANQSFCAFSGLLTA